MTAFCLSVSEQPWSSTLKPVLSAIDERPLLNEKLLELGRWIARYYAAPLGRTLDLMVPAAAKERAGWKKVKYAGLLSPDDPTSHGLQAVRFGERGMNAAARASLQSHGLQAVRSFDGVRPKTSWNRQRKPETPRGSSPRTSPKR